MRLSHDIWHQIIQYEDRKELLNLAVVSRLLSALALSSLWEEMRSLLPIVDIINHFTPTQEDPLLSWVNGNNCRFWKLSKKPNGNQVDLRVKEYLGRIREFRAVEADEEERALWPILLAWFGKTEPLLPNLRRLDCGSFLDRPGNPSHFLAFMVSPRLEQIETHLESFTHATTFYQLLFSRGCSPSQVTYCGEVPVPHTITLFKNLHRLEVWGHYSVEEHNSPFSLLELLSQLPSLKYLDIALATFPLHTSAPLDPLEHLALEDLLLQGTTEELQTLLSFPIICPLAKRLSLTLRFNTNTTWEFLLTNVIVTLPNLKELNLIPWGSGDTNTPKLVLSDFHSLLSQPVELLVVFDIPNKLSWKDLQQMFAAWSKLHTFELTGGKKPFDAKTLLSTFICHNMRTLSLPWDFTSLASTLIRPSVTQENSLKELGIKLYSKFPSTLEGKVTLAQNLLILLPELKQIRSASQLGPEAADLETIIKGMQHMQWLTAARAGI